MIQLRVNEHLAAPIEKIFEHIVDHESYATFAGVKAATLTRVGREERNGVGAQRTIKLPSIVLVEDIVGFERPTLMEYRIVKVRPPLIRHVLGRVRLTPEGDGTQVVWTSEFEARLPFFGHLLERKLCDQFTRAFRSMLREIERRILAA